MKNRQNSFLNPERRNKIKNLTLTFIIVIENISKFLLKNYQNLKNFYFQIFPDMMVPEGGSAKLVCKARGYPKPKITWKREDGREIIARSGTHGKTKCKSVTSLLFYSTIPKLTIYIHFHSTPSWRRNVIANKNHEIRNGSILVYSFEWCSPVSV